MAGVATLHGGVVLVPLDGSADAEAALPYAEVIARATAARLHLLSVVDELPSGLLAWRSQQPWLRQVRARYRERRQYLRETAQALAQRGVTVTTSLAAGDAAVAIRAVAVREVASLVVMATHGRSGVQRWFRGSVADAVLRTGERPWLLVPPGTKATATHPNCYRPKR